MADLAQRFLTWCFSTVERISSYWLSPNAFFRIWEGGGATPFCPHRGKKLLTGAWASNSCNPLARFLGLHRNSMHHEISVKVLT